MEYSAFALLDLSVCPEGTRHNDGQWVHEFLWIAPLDTIGDQDLDGQVADDIALYAPHAMDDSHARAWGDFGPPGSGNEVCPVALPRGTTASSGGLIGYADCHANRRIANDLAFIESDMTGPIGLAFEDPEHPETSGSLLNQAAPVNLWGNPWTGQGGLLEDGSAPGGAPEDPPFSAWDCGSEAFQVQSPVDVRDDTGLLRGRLGTTSAGATLFRDDGSNTVYDPDRTLYEGRLPVFIGIGNLFGSYYDALNDSYDAAVDRCETSDEPPAPAVEGGMVYTSARRGNDIVFHFQGNPAPAAAPLRDLLGSGTSYDLGLGLRRTNDGIGWVAASQVEQPGALRSGGQPHGARYMTFYANVGTTTLSAGWDVPLGGGTYGSQACGSFTNGDHGGFDCDSTL